MRIIKGNLITLALQNQFDLIGHGCNTQNVMGAGIAAQIAHRFPDAYIVDREYRRYAGINYIDMMGNYSAFYYNDEKSSFVILNMYTQMWPGDISPGCDIPFDYDAFAVICKKINFTYAGLPWVGCGLAGAFQPMVSSIMNDNLKDMDLTVVEYDKLQGHENRVALSRLGDVTSTGEGPDNIRRPDAAGYPMAASHGGGTTHAAGRAYWIGDDSCGMADKEQSEIDGDREFRKRWGSGESI